MTFLFQSRQVLAQQLAISRDLTEKLKENDDNSESESEEEKNAINSSEHINNAWINGIKTEEEITSFITSYRKYWDEHNKQNKISKNSKNCEKISEEPRDDEERIVNTSIHLAEEKKINENNKNCKKTSKSLTLKEKNTKKGNKIQLEKTPEWIVTNIDDNTAIENLFDNLEQNVKKTVQTKSKKILLSDSKRKRILGLSAKKKKTKKVDLSIPKPIIRPIIDEELMEQVGNCSEPATKELQVLQDMLSSKPETKKETIPSKDIKSSIKPILLNTELPELLTIQENDDDDDNWNEIPEAFEDDDAIEEFDQEKAKAIEKGKPKDIDLTLPGWGSWGGKDLDEPERKRKKFIIKFPQQPIRKDMNKGRVIINEDGNDKVRQYQVSEVPFPFKTVKDFEASIRAPVGSTFVPEIPHRKMTLPSVRTRMGTIIEPMSEEILLKKSLKGLPFVK